ncbi:ASCH domain-containing protein [Caldibacillus thermolactis]|uniref:ASCH domain-containing protein n=1 Tax=Pallidibacillus thermolactis TaxID=251051 RepID=A0ABT2WJA5_9BACI|nr:ASCH domain-containing protein [Pallidibacillus thermolactis]MCU9595526.1 ASCH domain-containing protein [Pallidibacillus thermolactis]MCU9601801.1 ASCH domain-containing protein [Pallidibacillus thermolactis subsp. kokeshiiformis]MED1674530.1 ASCH domain-containing protein [Pallidibacillus thermolactis subsp. kokeshiiformis]
MVNQHAPSEKENIERLITIPEDIKKVISGKKSATRRMKRFADVGEVMILEGQKFVIEKVYQQALGDITDEDAKKEGYESFESYKESILSIHPGMPWIPTLKVWVHEFSPIEKA